MNISTNHLGGRRRRRMSAERLEPRLLLHGNTLLWGGDGSLTLSFAPDGTKIGGLDSSLHAMLNELAPAEQWRETILRAFQTWASETNASIGVLEEDENNPLPFGASGVSRGDPRFGDIRIGAAPLADGVFAIAIPANDLLSGTWVGNIIFNSNAEFANLQEVFAVALHEAGHVFGLEHSDDPLSPMHVHGITPVTTVTTADIVDIQDLYGSPQPDLNERAVSNDTLSSATQLHLNNTSAGGEGSAPSLVYGTITGGNDVDYFRLTKPEGYLGSITITAQSKGISLLAPRLAVFDSKGALLSEKGSIGYSGDKIVLTISQTPADGQLFIRVAGAASDVFGVGTYSLAAVFDGVNQALDSVIDQAAGGGVFRFLPQQELAKILQQTPSSAEEPLLNDDLHTNDTLETAYKLTASPGYSRESRYEVVGSIADPSDVDYYRVAAPPTGGILTVRVGALESGGLMPKVTSLGKDHQVLPATILVNGAGEFVIQVSGIAAYEQVILGVAAADPSGLRATGTYQLLVDFDDDQIQLDAVASGILSPTTPIQEVPLYVAQPQLFHFALAIPAAVAPVNTAVIVSIRDVENNLIVRFAAPPGETRTAGSVLLKPGTYSVQTVLWSSEPLAEGLGYTLVSKASSQPFAADPDDPTYQPEFQCDEPDHAGMFCYPGHFISADPYLWGDFTDTVDEKPPEITFDDWVESLLADWWSWLWQQLGVNGPPLARSDTVSVPETDTSLTDAQFATIEINVLANDIEPEDDDVTALLRSPTTHGTLILRSDGTFEYTPNDGFEGVDSFTYVAFDSINESREVRVRIYVGFRGDYDESGAVDGHDFLAWQRTLGQTVSLGGSGADGDGDSVVTSTDGTVWAYNFGQIRPAPPAPLELPLNATIVDESLLTVSAVEAPASAESYAYGGAVASESNSSLELRRRFWGSHQFVQHDLPRRGLNALNERLGRPPMLHMESVLREQFEEGESENLWANLVDHALDERVSLSTQRLFL